MLTQTPLFGTLLNYSKFFDFIALQILWPLAIA